MALLPQDNANLLKRLKSGFKRTITWKKYELKVTVQQQNRYLDLRINPGFQAVNILFILSFEDNGGRTSYTRYYLSQVEINVMIDGLNFFNQPVKDNLITYGNIRKIAAGQGDDYTMI